ncbi:hypothetical protein [Virgibacillus halodenitrificans]|nr:hypothetical protein [Virgibacillus halodenitrificans]MEC2158066.1 hypothetical protein [Virgibacillus halodenitrificans]
MNRIKVKEEELFINDHFISFNYAYYSVDVYRITGDIFSKTEFL